MAQAPVYLKIFIVFLILFLSSCSFDPDSSLGKETFEEIVNNQSQANISVKSFEKTNGIKREVAGQPIYTLEYTSIVKFNNGGWKSKDFAIGYFHDFGLVAKEPMGWDAWGKNWKYFDAGDEVELTGEITFEKTEKGWRKIDYKVKTYKITFSKEEESISKLIGKWNGYTIYYDAQEGKYKQGAEQHCQIVRDAKGIKFIGVDGQVLDEDNAYLSYKMGKFYGSYLAGKHGGTHGLEWEVRFTLELKADNTLLFDDSRWKNEFKKEQ